MKSDDTKERLIKAGMELVPLHGYNATGIEAIIKKADVPKGSFYHYFQSKEKFGMALLECYVAWREKILDDFLLDTGKKPLERIGAYVEFVIGEMEEQGCRRGCLVGNLSQELSDQSESFRCALVEILERWQKKVTASLEKAQELGELHPETDCRATARFFFSALEGAILQAKVTRSVAPLRDIRNICARHFPLEKTEGSVAPDKRKD